MELAAFDRESRRHHAPRPGGCCGTPPTRPAWTCQDCPGYWLGPAAEALARPLRGDEVTAEAHTAEATGRDEERTSLFLTLALAVAGRYDAGRALAGTDPAAPGHDGDPGTSAPVDGLRQGRLRRAGAVPHRAPAGRVRRRLPAETAAAEGRRWHEQIASEGSSRSGGPPWLPRDLQSEAALTEPPVRGPPDRLRARVEGALPAAEPPAETADAVPEEFGALLTRLVDEGSPDEAPLLARARELRQIIENGAAAPPKAWDAEEGDTLDLLRGDMFERSRRPGACSRWRRAELDRRGSRGPGGEGGPPGPGAPQVRVGAWYLSIGPDGPESTAEMEAGVDDRVRRAAPSPSGPV